MKYLLEDIAHEIANYVIMVAVMFTALKVVNTLAKLWISIGA